MVGEIDAVTEHVPQFAATGEAFDLTPPKRARAPILQPTRPVVIGLAQIATANEVVEITHGRHKTIGEGRHVTHPGAIRGFGH